MYLYFQKESMSEEGSNPLKRELKESPWRKVFDKLQKYPEERRRALFYNAFMLAKIKAMTKARSEAAKKTSQTDDQKPE
jgi:hypothetical protein